MRSLRLSLLLALGLAAACRSSQAPAAAPVSDARKAALAQAQDLPGAQALKLTDPLAKTLPIDGEILELLPFGPETPVVAIEDVVEGAKRPVGIAFSVREDAAELTVRLLRRELARRESDRHVYVYEAPEPAGPGRVRVALLFGVEFDERAALRRAAVINEKLDPEAIADLLDESKDDLGLTLVGIGKTWVSFDLAPAKDSDAALDGLATAFARLSEGKDEDEEPSLRLVSQYLGELSGERHSFRLVL